MGAGKTQLTKKRVAFTDVTNQGNGFQSGSRAMVTHSKPMVPCTSKVAKKKETSTLPTGLNLESFDGFSGIDTVLTRDDHHTTKVSALPFPSSMVIFPCRSFDAYISLDETMSTCYSLESPKFEYLENQYVSAIKLIERKPNNNQYISEHTPKEGNILSEMGPNDNAFAVDNTSTDPQFCAAIAHVIYKNSRASETKKRPTTDFMEMVQKDVNASMRAILIDWLVEGYLPFFNARFSYLSGPPGSPLYVNTVLLHHFNCSNYEEISASQVEDFCYVTDNTYCKDEILQMESAVLHYLKFELKVPTTNFFLRQFVCSAELFNQVQSLQFECLASYIAELSLLEYTMLHHAPSLIAASAAFLAKFILSPSKRPWDFILGHYTQYQPSDLGDYVKALHHLCRNGGGENLPAIREKYSQHKYKFVAKKYCPASIPEEFFQDLH